ncbi:hypothetical protein ACPPVO_45865 [Dactylosporangium sp. McL0621]|uniref:hypothetical protein n=1 Tax=Dactylosporangium sp. McL0621 TaxID=3415678 RepID=UPI003CEE06A7
MPSAPDPGHAATTRAVSIYSLSPRLPATGSSSLAAALDLGFLQRFVHHSVNLFPSVLRDVDADPAKFRGGTVAALERLRAVVLRTSRGDPVLIVEAHLADTATAGDILAHLSYMHYERDDLAYGDGLLLDWLAAQLEGVPPGTLRIGYAHQMVFAGESLTHEIMHDGQRRDGAVETLLRGLAAQTSGLGGQVGVRLPGPLNIEGRTYVANSRYATVVAGWSPSVQNALIFVALTVVAAFGVLRGARSLAFHALEHDLSAPMTTIEEAREQHARLAADLGEIQLDLSFGVEAYLDSVLMPDSRMDSFRTSYHEVVGIEAAVANTSQIVERLRAVIQTRSSVLAEASREREERRDRVLTGLLASVSLLAIPLTLLLAFFGVSSSDVGPDRSMLDLGYYWPAYALAWVPIGVIVLVGVVLRRRLREARPRMRGLDR